MNDDAQEMDEEFMVIADGTTGDYVNYNGVVTITIEGTDVAPGRLLASVPSSFPAHFIVQLESRPHSHVVHNMLLYDSSFLPCSIYWDCDYT